MIPAGALLLSGIAAYYALLYFPYTIGFASLLFLTFLLSKKRYALAAFFLVGALLAFVRSPVADDALKNETVTVEGSFVSPPEEFYDEKFSQHFESPRLGKIRVDSDRAFDTGRNYRLRLQVIKPAGRLNPGARPREPYARLIGVVSAGGEKPASPIALMNDVRWRIEGYMRENFGGERAAFLSAITVGRRAHIGEELNRAFGVTGLVHLLSISGTHFGLLFLMLFWALKGIVRHIPIRALERITLRLTLSELAALLSLPFMLLYLSVSGAGIPTLRSFILIMLFLAGLLLGRKGQWLNSLMVAAVIIVLWEPGALFNLSFELSFLSVLFIGWMAGDETSREKIADRVPFVYVRNAFRVSFAASIGVAPLVAYYFHYASLISPVANFVVTPLIGFLVLPLTLFGSLSYILTGHFVVGSIVDWLSGLSLMLVRAFASVPNCSVNISQFPLALILFFYSGLLIFAVFGRRAVKAMGLAIAFLPILVFSISRAVVDDHLSVTFLDTGHADAAVIRGSGGHTIVVDTGRNGREVGDYLDAVGEKTIDALVITHSHEDHAGGLGYLLRRFDVNEVWDHGRLHYDPPFERRHRALHKGDRIEFDDAAITVLHPSKDFIGYSENDESLVLRLEGKETSFLMAADIGLEAEDYLERTASSLKSDVLKVPHHGSESSAHEGFIGAVAPKVSVVPSWRRLNTAMSEALKNSTILNTRMTGAIKIEDGMKIKTCRDYELKKTIRVTEEFMNVRRLFLTW